MILKKSGLNLDIDYLKLMWRSLFLGLTKDHTSDGEVGPLALALEPGLLARLPLADLLLTPALPLVETVVPLQHLCRILNLYDVARDRWATIL